MTYLMAKIEFTHSIRSEVLWISKLSVMYSMKQFISFLVLKNILEKHLSRQIPVLAVVAVMGTTEESSIDPLTDILGMRKDFSKKVKIDGHGKLKGCSEKCYG